MRRESTEVGGIFLEERISKFSAGGGATHPPPPPHHLPSRENTAIPETKLNYNRLQNYNRLNYKMY